MTEGIVPQKRCSKCGELKPGTLEYFSKATKHKDGLQYHCKECNHKYSAANKERISQRRRDYRTRNQDEISKRKRVYYQQNREKHAIKNRDYRQQHREEIIEYQYSYQRENREKLTEYGRNYNRKYPHLAKVRNHRFRARKRMLPDTFTPQQWQHALDYFNGCCAVCSRPLRDLFATHSAAADHWIPLNNPDCPGTVATNMIPLCHGQDGCNNSKCDKNASDWLITRYGKRKASAIIQRIETYFDWIKQQQ